MKPAKQLDASSQNDGAGEALNTELFNEHAETYDASLAKSTRWVSSDISYFAEHKVQQIGRCLSCAPKSILDYGCGIGRNIPFLKSRFPHASHYGCDISDQSLAMARERNPGATFFLNNERASGLRFEVIVVANVFHHVIPVERPGVIQQLKEFLSPRGTVFVFEHNPLNPLTQYSVKQCPFDKDAQLVGPGALASLFTANGWTLRRIDYTLFFPEWARSFAWLERYLGWLPLGAQYFLQLECEH
jgi:SAM-dependent methyltransferase